VSELSIALRYASSSCFHSCSFTPNIRRTSYFLLASYVPCTSYVGSFLLSMILVLLRKYDVRRTYDVYRTYDVRSFVIFLPLTHTFFFRQIERTIVRGMHSPGAYDASVERTIRHMAVQRTVRVERTLALRIAYDPSYGRAAYGARGAYDGTVLRTELFNLSCGL
jgi:hypothetical protein